MDRIDFSRPYFSHAEADAAAEAVSSGWVVGGPRLATFEQAVADQCQASQGVGVSSWTAGGFLVLKAWGIGPGDEVIVPSLTFIASANVIAHVGATVVFCDVLPGTYNIDPKDVARKITSKTKVIIAIDQIGQPCDIDGINALARDNGLLVLHDAACSLGARTKGRPVGSLADATIFSLHARKVITTGEGGLILTEDASLSARLKRLRHQGMSLSDAERHGQSPTLFESYDEIGYNFRITDIQAAIGLAQLEKLPDILARRKEAALAYSRALADCPHLTLPVVAEGVEPNWQSYMVVIDEDAPVSRNELMDRLFEAGIPTRRGIMASHHEGAYASTDAGALPVTDHLARQGLLLPMHPALKPDQVDFVADNLRAFLSRSR